MIDPTSYFPLHQHHYCLRHSCSSYFDSIPVVVAVAAAAAPIAVAAEEERHMELAAHTWEVVAEDIPSVVAAAADIDTDLAVQETAVVEEEPVVANQRVAEEDSSEVVVTPRAWEVTQFGQELK